MLSQINRGVLYHFFCLLENKWPSLYFSKLFYFCTYAPISFQSNCHPFVTLLSLCLYICVLYIHSYICIYNSQNNSLSYLLSSPCVYVFFYRDIYLNSHILLIFVSLSLSVYAYYLYLYIVYLNLAFHLASLQVMYNFWIFFLKQANHDFVWNRQHQGSLRTQGFFIRCYNNFIQHFVLVRLCISYLGHYLGAGGSKSHQREPNLPAWHGLIHNLSLSLSLSSLR